MLHWQFSRVDVLPLYCAVFQLGGAVENIVDSKPPLNLELLRGLLVCHCLPEKIKSCALATENLPCPIKTLGTHLKQIAHFQMKCNTDDTHLC